MADVGRTGTIAAVILAAGRGTRFGGAKPHARLGPRTMLGVVADTATAAGLAPIIAVVPPDTRVPEHVQPVANATPDAGMSRSLQLGLAALPEGADAAVVLLADQPTVSVDQIARLVGSRGSAHLVATRFDGLLGAPALVERAAFGMADGLAGDVGLRDLLRAAPEEVTAVDVEHPIPDVDSPADLDRITESCPGCGARYLPHQHDETHPYIGASAACWAAFGELLAREFGDVAYGRMHRHTVDVYAVQHPGRDDRRQRQSVAIHLIGLCQWLEHGLDTWQVIAGTQAMLRDSGPDWPWLDPPEAYDLTVLDVLDARDGMEHGRLVRRWAESTWEAWSAHHETVRRWVGGD